MEFDEKQILEKLSTPRYRPMTFEGLCHLFQVPSPLRKKFRRVLKQLRHDFKLVRMPDKRYRLISQDDYVIGTVKKHPEGFGFLIPDEPGPGIEDVYINRFQMMDVMDKDRIKALVTEEARRGGRKSGRVIEILERGARTVVGKLNIRGKTAYVIPQGSSAEFGGADHILIPFNGKLVSQQNKVVICNIKKYPQKHRWAEGEIKEILGEIGEPEVDLSMIVHKFQLRDRFDEKICGEAADFKKWGLQDEIQKRVNLKKLPFVTIDGETAKDFDDAVCVKKLVNGNFKLWVAIADVSFFVKEGSFIDEEAYERAASFYYPGGVIPMLPEILSNDLCSLKPNEDKLTFCCEMEFDSEGNRIDYLIYESLILSRHRLTYTAVQDILDGDAVAKKKYPELISDVLVMNDLKELLKKKREVRGCLDFDLPESELVLNMQGDVESIMKRPRLEAHMLIEEFMIAANEAVAEYMFFKKKPFIYRVHEEPDQSALAQYHELSDHLGHPLPRSKKPDPKIYSDLLEKIKNLPEEKILNTALLRSMKQARYSEKNSGHFGLASKCYTHFTSPIRRYPDLVVHRLIKEELKKKTKFSDTKNDPGKIAAQAYHCSNRERLIEGAEREFMALKKAQFMCGKVGSQFEGYISGMIEFGFFVELASYFVEGLVPLSTLHDDRYQFIPERYLIRGRRFRQEFHLGQKVLVEVRSVNLDKRQIDFRLIE